MPLGAYSEVGTLRKVLVHRPGLEHTRLTPSNAEELLFDDVLWVTRAKAEHDMFCEVMRERGVQVFEVETLLAETLVKPEVKDWVSDNILSERQVGVLASRRAREWVETADPAQVAEFLIGGITRTDVQRESGLAWETADPTTMLLPPLPNFLFQRDPSCWIFNGVTINPMTKPARIPETQIMETIYRFHPMFAAEEFPILLGGSEENWGRCHVEGGDVQPIGNGTVMIGEAGLRRAPAQIPLLHAPGHGHHHVRPGPGHAVPPGRLRGADLGDPARGLRRGPRDRGAGRDTARTDGQGAGSTEDARRGDGRGFLRSRAGAVGRRQQRRRAGARPGRRV